MRTYQQIWTELLRRKSLVVAVELAARERLIAAVRKEKWKDSRNRKKFMLCVKRVGKEAVKFKLRDKINLYEV